MILESRLLFLQIEVISFGGAFCSALLSCLLSPGPWQVESVVLSSVWGPLLARVSVGPAGAGGLALVAWKLGEGSLYRRVARLVSSI